MYIFLFNLFYWLIHVYFEIYKNVHITCVFVIIPLTMKLRGGYWIQNVINCIGGVMVSVLVSSAVEREFEPRLGQTKNYKIGICCFSAKHTALRRKSKGWLARNQNNVSEWSDISTCGLLFQWASTIKKNPTQHVGLEQRTSSTSHWKLKRIRSLGSTSTTGGSCD